MFEWYAEAKRLLAPYSAIIIQMAKHFIFLDGNSLRANYDAQGEIKRNVIVALLVACAVVYLAYEALSRVFAFGDFLSNARIFIIYTLLSLPLAAPLYIALRPYGSQTYYFVAEIALLTTLLISLFMLIAGPFAVEASGGLVRDIQAIQAGTGQNTQFYKAFCLPLDEQIKQTDILVRLNAITGESDKVLPLYMAYRSDPSDDNRNRYINAELASIISLSPSDRAKAQALRQALFSELDNYPTDTILGGMKYSFVHYAPIFLFGFVIFLLSIAGPIWCYIASWRAFIKVHPSKQLRTKGKKRLWGAAIASFAATVLFSMMGSGAIQTGTFLQNQVGSLSMRAYFAQPTCGKLDSHGLW